MIVLIVIVSIAAVVLVRQYLNDVFGTRYPHCRCHRKERISLKESRERFERLIQGDA